MKTTPANPFVREISPIRFSVLNDDQIEQICQAAYWILEHVGCKILHKEARQLLAQAGATVKDEQVKLPRYIVEECVRWAPKGFTIFNRSGQPALAAYGRNVYFGTSTASPNTIDARTGEVHPTGLQDIARGARIANALEHIDWVMPFGSAQDVPGKAADLHEFLATVTNTTKPVAFCGYSGRGVTYVYEMAAEIAGGLDALQQHPFVLAYPEPITPLTYPAAVIERMFVAADLRQPQIPSGSQQPGATSPISLAGTLAQATAESLMSITLIQLKQKGAPVFMACNIGGFNMRSGIMSIVPPEVSLGLAAQAEIARSFGLPSWGLAGATDAKRVDAQAGAESAFSILAQALAGLTLIHDVGYADMGMSCSADMLVLGNELIGCTRRFLRGIRVDASEIGLETIGAIGPGGNYLLAEETTRRCRSEYWMSDLFTREPYSVWQQNGATDMQQRIHTRVLQLLDEHQAPQLPDGTREALEKIKIRGQMALLKNEG